MWVLATLATSGPGGLTALLLGLALELPIDGQVACPSPRDVAARVRPLLGGVVGQPGDRVRLARADGVLSVALLRADGGVRGERHVDDRHDCDDLAEAAAIIIASWQHAPEVADAAPGDLRAPASKATAATTMWQIGLGIGGELADGIVAALDLEATVGRRAGGLGLHLRAIVGGRHAEALASGGQARWRRPAIALGPAWTWRFPALDLAGDLSGTLAWLSAEGVGLAANQTSGGLDLGVAAGLRATTRWAARPWAGVAAAFWPRRTFLVVGPDDPGRPIARFHLVLVAGAAIGG